MSNMHVDFSWKMGRELPERATMSLGERPTFWNLFMSVATSDVGPGMFLFAASLLADKLSLLPVWTSHAGPPDYSTKKINKNKNKARILHKSNNNVRLSRNNEQHLLAYTIFKIINFDAYYVCVCVFLSTPFLLPYDYNHVEVGTSENLLEQRHLEQRWQGGRRKTPSPGRRAQVRP